jgi:uncharacterized protein YbaR (Trm112 family)
MTVQALRIERLASRLRCPECGTNDAPLRGQADEMVCPLCHMAFPVAAGVPRLLSGAGRDARQKLLGSETGAAMVAEYASIEASAKACARRAWYSYLRPPQSLLHTNPHLSARHTKPLFDHRGAATVVLNVGGGPHRYSPTEITLNLEAFANVDLVGDAHNIPLLDDSVDSIICNAVLEHVGNAERVVAEMIRVLRPGGILYAEMPFIFFFHGYPSDFRRFTREGVRQLFGQLENLEIGIAAGPMSALLISANMVLQMLVPPRPRVLRKAFNGVYRLLTFPFKYLDRVLNRREEAHLVAAGFYVLGRKAGSPEQRA